MKALTIKEPWATAIVRGWKRVENRTWRQESIIGELIAIHAGKTPDTARQRAICEMTARREDPANPHDRSLEAPGCIVGFARVEDVVDYDPRENLVICFDEPTWFTGPYGYLLSEVSYLETPIPCKGALRFWEVPEEVLEQIESTRIRETYLSMKAPEAEHARPFDAHDEFDIAFEDTVRALYDNGAWLRWPE